MLVVLKKFNLFLERNNMYKNDKSVNKNHKNSDYMQELVNSEVMKNYNNFIVHNCIKNIFLKKNIKFVDFGAGIGTLSIIFKKKYSINPLCVEIDDEYQKILTSRKLNVCYKLPKNTKFNVIFSSNVIEHIKNDQEVINNFYEKLNKNGTLYLFLPAKNVLWSKFDILAGHYRRYEPRDIKDKCIKAGFKIQKVRYADSAGFFATLLTKYIGYNSNKGIGSLNSLKFYDKFIIPISLIFDKIGFSFLFGRNLFLIAKK